MSLLAKRLEQVAISSRILRLVHKLLHCHFFCFFGIFCFAVVDSNIASFSSLGCRLPNAELAPVISAFFLLIPSLQFSKHSLVTSIA